MATEIKSLRVRRVANGGSGEIDVKITLIKRLSNNYEVIWLPNGSIPVTYYYKLNNIDQSKKDYFSNIVKGGDLDISDPLVIKGFNPNTYIESDVLLNETILQRQRSDSTNYEIVQDPWSDTPPIWRKFGNDIYYLNNGSKLFIKWVDENGNMVGGLKWSDENGEELKSIDDIDKSKYSKMVYIYEPNYEEIMISTSGELIRYAASVSEKVFFGLNLDIDIIKNVLITWKIKVPNYNIELNDPNNVSSQIIKYISPVGELNEPSDPEEDNVSQPKAKKEKITIITPKDLIARVKKDIDNIRIFIGNVLENVTAETTDGFIFESNISDQDLLGSEYTESGFVGEEESVMVKGQKIVLFDDVELNRDYGEDIDAGIVNTGGSYIQSPNSHIPNNVVPLPKDLENVQNSHVIFKQSLGGGSYRALNNDVYSPKKIISGYDIVSDMNAFVIDVLGPFATFLKTNYPILYKDWYISSATRGYVPVGGSLTSQHFKGQAIDSQILGSRSYNPQKNIDLLNAILEWYKDNKVGYGQILFETRNDSCWIHWSYSRAKNKLQLLRFKSDRTLRTALVNTTGKYVLPPVTSNLLAFS